MTDALGNQKNMQTSEIAIEAAADRNPKPPFIVFHAPEGFGKTSAALKFPNALLLDLEDGAGSVAVDRARINSFESLVEAIRALHADMRGYRTIMLDTFDAAVALIEAQVCLQNNWKHIEDAPYGRGRLLAADLARKVIISGLQALRTKHNVIPVVATHTAIRNYRDPQFGEFDRHELRAHRHAAAVLIEAADVIAFGFFATRVSKTKGDFGRVQARGVGEGERRILLESRPWAVAKNRFGLPVEMSFDPAALLAAIHEGGPKP